MTDAQALQAAIGEVMSLSLETALPRLSVLLVDVGHAELVPDVLQLQSTIVGVFAPPRRRSSPRRKK